MITVLAQEYSKHYPEVQEPQVHKEDYCTWFINRDKNMEWNAHKGNHADPEDISVCVMLGYSELSQINCLQVPADLLVRITNGDQSKLSQIKYGTTKINKQLEGVPEENTTKHSYRKDEYSMSNKTSGLGGP